MKSLIVALSIIGSLFLLGCGPTNYPRKDLPISKYEDSDLEFAVISGSVSDEVFVALDKSGWREAGSAPGHGGFYPRYFLVRKK